MTFAAAIAALDGGDPGAALVALLDAWREVPDPTLAEIIERSSVRGPPIVGKTVAARDAEFEHRLAKRDPFDLPILLAHALERRQSAMIPARLVAELARWPRDPRTTRPLLAALARPSWDSTSAHGMWDAIFKLLAHTADPRAVAGIAELDFAEIWARRQFGQPHTTAIRGMERRRDKLLAAIQVGSTDGAHAATIAALDERTRTPRSTQALIDAVLDHPDRADAREVLRDALLEVGDPRGEHMALDVIERTRSLTPAEVKRRFELQRDARWWPGLEDVVYVPVVRDGFLAGCMFSVETEHLLEPTIGHRSWRTVERIDLGWWNVPLPVALFADPAMCSLAALGSVPVELAPSIWTATWLRTVEIRHLAPAWSNLLNRRDALPNLRRLETDQYYDRVPEYAWLWETQVFRRARELTCNLGRDPLASWYRLATGKSHVHLERIELGRYHFERDANGRLSRLTVTLPASAREKPNAKFVAAALAELTPGSIVEARFVGRALDKKTRKLFEAALATQQLERFTADPID